MFALRTVIYGSFIVYSLVLATGCGPKSGSQAAAKTSDIEITQNDPNKNWSNNVKLANVNLDSVSYFNIFLFGDLNQPSSDTEGAVAVGGNATLANYSIGDVLPTDKNRYDLVVGGNLDFQSGAVVNGAAIVAGKIKVGSTSFKGGVKQGASPVDFALAKKNLTAESHRLAQLATNGTIKFEDWGQERGELSLEGNDSYNVFNIEAAILARTHTLRITAPQDAYVMVNVTGSSVRIKSLGMTVTGTVRNRVLFNLPTATNLQIAEISFEGSLLAPHARIDFATGVIRGQVIAQSLYGRGQINDDPYDKPKPDPKPPIPVDPDPIQDLPPKPPELPDNPEVPYL